MLPSPHVEAAIRSIAAWASGPVSYEAALTPVMSPMHRGVSSECLRVGIGDAPPAFFVKILHRDLAETVDIGASWRAAAAVAAIGLTPGPRHLNELFGISAFDLLDDTWQTAHLDDLAKPDTLEKLLAAKRAIHVLPAFERNSNVFDRVGHLAASMTLTADVATLVVTASRMSAAITASGIDTCPCHADGVTSNVMLRAGGPGADLQLVDFDEASNTDPAFDIAVTLNEVLPELSTWPAALEMANGHVTDAALARTRCYAFADDLRWGLWGLKMNATSPRRHVEFLKYAQWRLLRCSMAASRMDTDDLLPLL
ncbi:phosphotransferase [uncultured Caballeronia sp.]|uniref:phosphotransferase n=1 Tax=uncultured Caballeronia sp. TaxID=1827198 RepID=UPI00157557C1